MFNVKSGYLKLSFGFKNYFNLCSSIIKMSTTFAI